MTTKNELISCLPCVCECQTTDEIANEIKLYELSLCCCRYNFKNTTVSNTYESRNATNNFKEYNEEFECVCHPLCCSYADYYQKEHRHSMYRIIFCINFYDLCFCLFSSHDKVRPKWWCDKSILCFTCHTDANNKNPTTNKLMGELLLLSETTITEEKQLKHVAFL